uniref:Guanine nucleotide-binding protein G(O) subunit alpha n=1 Tax=Neogobius melanostomus TaxID=47308 RepID=A0A8C6TAT2_9GOBI
MGLCLKRGVKEEGKMAKLNSSRIEQDLSEHAKTERNVVKILLLGTAESGKSTLIKQIKIIHSQGFSKQERLSFKSAVFDNLLTSMKFVLRGMGMLRIKLANKKNTVHARSILSCSQCLGKDQELLPFVAHAFCALWSDQGVRTAAVRGYEFDLNDSALYFFENLSRIISPSYVPSETDVLRVRVRTSGIIETQFHVNDFVFRLYDVGGQRSERRKWLNCFDCIQAVLFVVALSGYDSTLTKDPLAVCYSNCDKTFLFFFFLKILFMNKTDIFKKKILNSGRHLRFYLLSYTGADCDVDAAASYITTLFLSCNIESDKPVYHHFTTATDRANMTVVFQMLTQQILMENIAAVKLL